MTSETGNTQGRESDDEEQFSESCQLIRTRRQEAQNDEANEDLPEMQENKEDISLLWFDKNLNSNIKDIKLTKDLLRQINNYVLFFTNQSECLKYIQQVKNEKILLIISGSSTIDNEFLKQIHEFRQIDSLFIFCVEKEKYEQLLSNMNYQKIIGIFTDQETLMRTIRHTIKLIEQQSSVFILYNHTQKTTRNLANESGSFIWHQLLKDVLQRMPIDAIAGKREMLDICYKYYRDNKRELQNIQQFEKTYTSDDAIRWYTKDGFIYRLINKALRTEDIEVLHTFRYYINGLSACLGRDYELRKQRQTETLKLYRGITQTNDEIQRLQTSIGKLISTNGFFSTTKNKRVAEMYAGIGCNNFKYESLLFEIDIDMQTHTHCIFADVSCYSLFSDEQEVLFDLGTVFEIASVDYNSTDQYWICQMMSTNRGLQIAEEYLTLRKSEMTSEDVDLSVLFGHLLYDMGEYNKSQKYFENLFADRGNDANVYLGIGHAQYIRGEHQEAIKSYKRAYDVCDSSDFLLIAKLLNYLGFVHKHNREYDIAFNCLFDALNILDKNKSSDQSHRLRADIFKNISELYICVGKIIKALEYADGALNIIEKLVPCPHLDLIEALTSVALAY
ncbi:unnamed protein product [Didymodactylos carnosus]|uniref:ADP ribosyltransferase domain-containing protein n=1 Tax=Didymodactylos carnosus TaxID=1234261 RepID=A0A815F4E0_9BILA|nr:unnamed protein product [Didymodactylos carnosus]CAF1323435.1 unnamed protein product [Didymodactylos carnosus]CAF3920461.1 unnamed protein product [Didymodactylos carnosus]CAF4171323.1 unnamed protein product [Didymodactylos carnosus]